MLPTTGISDMTDERISPRDFGALEAQVHALSTQVKSMDRDIKELLGLANKSKGGFWAGMAIASGLGSMATIAVEVFRR